MVGGHESRRPPFPVPQTRPPQGWMGRKGGGGPGTTPLPVTTACPHVPPPGGSPLTPPPGGVWGWSPRPHLTPKRVFNLPIQPRASPIGLVGERVEFATLPAPPSSSPKKTGEEAIRKGSRGVGKTLWQRPTTPERGGPTPPPVPGFFGGFKIYSEARGPHRPWEKPRSPPRTTTLLRPETAKKVRRNTWELGERTL